jgi:hypothetical protein
MTATFWSAAVFRRFAGKRDYPPALGYDADLRAAEHLRRTPQRKRNHTLPMTKLVGRLVFGVRRLLVFPLYTANFPSSAPDLECLLNHGLQRSFSFDADPVRVRDASYPHLKEIRVCLDGARLRSNPPRPASIRGETFPALRVDQLSLSAQALSIGPASIDLSLHAHTVDFVQGKDSNEQVALALKNAADGKIEVSISHTSLAALITTLAQDQASKQGITISEAQLDLRPNNPHSLAAQVRLRVRKLFLNASLSVTGQLDLDDHLNLKISGLNCTGDGAIASLACAILTPYLRKIEDQEIPLMLLPLGEIRLRDARLAVDDNLSITAEFGSAI